MDMTEWKTEFSKNLNNLVKNSGLTANQFRESAGFTSATWYNYTNGVRLPKNPTDCEKLAAPAGVSPARLFGWDSATALPPQAQHLKTVLLDKAQLGYPQGTAIHYDEKTKGPSDGTYLLNLNGAKLLRRVTIRLDDQIEVSNGETSETYSPGAFDHFVIIGKVKAITLMI